MTSKQKENYNRMVRALKAISNYQSVERINRYSERDWGLSPKEVLEMTHEDMVSTAKNAVRGVKII